MSEKSGVNTSEAASIKSITRSRSFCRASINSHDENVTTPWVPKGISTTEKVHSASSRAVSPVRCSIESSGPPKGRLGSSDGGSKQPLKRMSTVQRHKPSRSTTWRIRSEGTALANGGDPGVWAISHHKSNFIQNIKKKPTSRSILRRLWKRGQDAKDRSEAPDEENSFRVSLAELQRMRLRKLQCQLVKHVAHMKTTGKESENWENDLETYIKAVQDYDHMTSHSKLPRDPFYVTGERYVDAYVLHSLLGDAAKDITGEPILVNAPWETTEEPIGGTRNEMTAKSESANFKKRIAIAAVAGFFLIGPMWLMVLHNTLYTCLVSTTVSVTVFGIILACSLDSPKEVMSGTAAYAAILVVFVGVGNTG
ncbi:hypothetical protein F4782DRAFT_82845 [Xylaria castorea]|nr:hypothetical protein F4782DRAFT_82845 [Xylaria castorea]